ncbi:hypothetical protein H0H93_002648 [Arthromyces matolae]|nr:hypothetical protein H0H93_002648 [Arthromyces matolae]
MSNREDSMESEANRLFARVHYPDTTPYPPTMPLYIDSNVAPDSSVLAGSLDLATGIFYRSYDSPRLRTAQACEKCRARKAKCSGEHPTCKRCFTRGLVCEYAKEGRVRGPNKIKPKPTSLVDDTVVSDSKSMGESDANIIAEGRHISRTPVSVILRPPHQPQSPFQENPYYYSEYAQSGDAPSVDSGITAQCSDNGYCNTSDDLTSLTQGSSRELGKTFIQTNSHVSHPSFSTSLMSRAYQRPSPSPHTTESYAPTHYNPHYHHESTYEYVHEQVHAPDMRHPYEYRDPDARSQSYHLHYRYS